MATLEKHYFDFGYCSPNAKYREPLSQGTFQYARERCNKTYAHSPRLRFLMGLVYQKLDPASESEFDIILENHKIVFDRMSRQSLAKKDNQWDPAFICAFLNRNFGGNHAFPAPDNTEFHYIQTETDLERWEFVKIGTTKERIKGNMEKVLGGWYMEIDRPSVSIGGVGIRVSGKRDIIDRIILLRDGDADKKSELKNQLERTAKKFIDALFGAPVPCRLKLALMFGHPFEIEIDDSIFGYDVRLSNPHFSVPEQAQVRLTIERNLRDASFS